MESLSMGHLPLPSSSDGDRQKERRAVARPREMGKEAYHRPPSLPPLPLLALVASEGNVSRRMPGSAGGPAFLGQLFLRHRETSFFYSFRRSSSIPLHFPRPIFLVVGVIACKRVSSHWPYPWLGGQGYLATQLWHESREWWWKFGEDSIRCPVYDFFNREDEMGREKKWISREICIAEIAHDIYSYYCDTCRHVTSDFRASKQH